MKAKPKAKKPAARRPAGDIRALQDALGVTRSRVHQLLRDGMPGDVAGALTWRSQRQAHELKEARLAVLNEQRRKLELENAAKSGALLPASEVDARDARIATATRSALMAMINNLPPRLAGLSEPQIAKVMQAEVENTLRDLSDEQSAPWQEAFRVVGPEPS